MRSAEQATWAEPACTIKCFYLTAKGTRQALEQKLKVNKRFWEDAEYEMRLLEQIRDDFVIKNFKHLIKKDVLDMGIK